MVGSASLRLCRPWRNSEWERWLSNAVRERQRVRTAGGGGGGDGGGSGAHGSSVYLARSRNAPEVTRFAAVAAASSHEAISTAAAAAAAATPVDTGSRPVILQQVQLRTLRAFI